jgi:hypothetical protein
MTFRQKHVELKNRLQFQIVSSLEKCRMNKQNVPFMNVVQGKGGGNLGWASLGINRFDVFPFHLCYFIFWICLSQQTKFLSGKTVCVLCDSKAQRSHLHGRCTGHGAEGKRTRFKNVLSPRFVSIQLTLVYLNLFILVRLHSTYIGWFKFTYSGLFPINLYWFIWIYLFCFVSIQLTLLVKI